MNEYSMVFAFSEDLREVLLLRKPDDHKNPLFRGRWTVPGGLKEANETILQCAAREMAEETGLQVKICRLNAVLHFTCDCDESEPEHLVHVYGTRVTARMLKAARGSNAEPVRAFHRLYRSLPEDSVWQLQPLMDLVVGRMKQSECRTLQTRSADLRPIEAKKKGTH